MNNTSKNILAGISFSLISSWVVSSPMEEGVASTTTIIAYRGQECMNLDLPLSVRANCQLASSKEREPEWERLVREKRAEVNRLLEWSSFSLTPGGKHGIAEPTYKAGNMRWKLRTSSGGIRFKWEMEF
jgi:hypothetical protein